MGSYHPPPPGWLPGGLYEKLPGYSGRPQLSSVFPSDLPPGKVFGGSSPTEVVIPPKLSGVSVPPKFQVKNFRGSVIDVNSQIVPVLHTPTLFFYFSAIGGCWRFGSVAVLVELWERFFWGGGRRGVGVVRVRSSSLTASVKLRRYMAMSLHMSIANFPPCFDRRPLFSFIIFFRPKTFLGIPFRAAGTISRWTDRVQILQVAQWLSSPENMKHLLLTKKLTADRFRLMLSYYKIIF